MVLDNGSPTRLPLPPMTAAPDTHTIAFIGDLHGNMTAFEYTLTAALRLRVTTIIQAGDFWIYDQPHHPDNLERVITRVARNADLAPATVDYRFIDGNHENFDVLDPDATAPVQLTEHVTYMPRGSRATLAGVEILFFGGASSVDRHCRTEGEDWWPDENITDTQLARGLAAANTGPVDVLVTHETTTAAFNALCGISGHARSKRDDAPGEANRARLDTLVDTAQPRALVHGHHHTSHIEDHDGVRVVSLGQEDSAESVALLDTDTWLWSEPPRQPPKKLRYIRF